MLGCLTILLGLVFLGVVPWMQRDWRVHKVPSVGPRRGPVARGALRPWLGAVHRPTLTAVMSLALNEASAGRGALLSFVYCLGLGLPFILAALAYRRMLGTVGWVRRHQQWVTAFGGVMLIAVGLLLVTGWWDVLVDWIRTWFFPDFDGGCVVAGSRTDTPKNTGPATGYEAPPLRPRELARWSWRQLTSMRTALILLFLLALAAIPGSVVPQEAVDSLRASQWRDQHPKLTPVYEKLGLFSVYDSVWFSAIYILLIDLAGGLLHPADADLLARRTCSAAGGSPEPLPPAPAPHLRDRRGARRRARAGADAAGEAAVPGLDRLDRRAQQSCAERGYLREAGNLLFHLSVLVVLVGFAVGGLWGFKGGVIVVTEDGFANTLSQYDDFRAGALFDPAELDPFDFTVDDFDVTFIREGREAGMAHKFAADLTYRTSPAAPERKRQIAVNHPLTIDGTDVFLISHGYAPHITVRNADSSIAFSGPVVFLPEDSTFRSFGVVKVPDASQQDGSDPARARGRVLPDVRLHQGQRTLLRLPRRQEPRDLDAGLQAATSVSTAASRSRSTRCRRRVSTRSRKADGKPVRLDLAIGRSARLPDGLGTVTFDGVSRYVKLQVSHTPGQKIALGGVVLALTGLLGSLFIRPRRIWVRTRRDGGRTLVEVAGLDRSSGGDLSVEVDALTDALRPASGRGTGADQQAERVRRVVVTHDAVRGAQQPGRGGLRRRLLPRVLAHFAQWAAGRQVAEPRAAERHAGARGAQAADGFVVTPVKPPSGARGRVRADGACSAGSASPSPWSRRSCTSSPW